MNNKIIELYASEFVNFSKSASTQQKLDDMSELIESLESDEIIKVYLQSPVISDEKKVQLIENFTQNSDVLRLIAILAKRSRLEYTILILKAAIKIIKSKNGTEEVIVTSVVQLSEEQKNKVEILVKKLFNSDSEIVNYLSDSIIGGLTIQIGDRLLDLSIRKQFELMEKSMI